MGLRPTSELQSDAVILLSKCSMKSGLQILTVVHQETSTPGFLGEIFWPEDIHWISTVPASETYCQKTFPALTL